MYFIYQVIICFIYNFCRLISFSSLQSRDDFIHTLLTSLGHIFLVFFLVLFEFFILILLRTFFLTLLSQISFWRIFCHCCWYYSHSLHWYLWLLSTIYAVENCGKIFIGCDSHASSNSCTSLKYLSDTFRNTCLDLSWIFPAWKTKLRLSFWFWIWCRQGFEPPN